MTEVQLESEQTRNWGEPVPEIVTETLQLIPEINTILELTTVLEVAAFSLVKAKAFAVISLQAAA